MIEIDEDVLIHTAVSLSVSSLASVIAEMVDLVNMQQPPPILVGLFAVNFLYPFMLIKQSFSVVNQVSVIRNIVRPIPQTSRIAVPVSLKLGLRSLTWTGIRR
jgi:hypothetical protein